MKKVVLMCQQMGEIERSPARYQLLEALKQKSFETYLFLPKEKISIEIQNNIDYVVDTSKMSAHEIRKKIVQIHPNSVVATTYDDTRIIYILPWILKKTAFYYYNLEIYTKHYEAEQYDETDIFRSVKWRINYFFNKLKEMVYTQKTKLLIVQDSLRKKVLAKYHIRHKHTILVPNSYTYDKNNKIEVKREGIIYSGGMWEVFLGSDIERIYENKNIPITFMGNPPNIYIANKFRTIQRYNPNIKIEKPILSPKDYTEYLQHFAVGLVLYNSSEDDNLNYIGLSSGKLFKHLSMGQPVIVSDCPGVGKEVRKYNLGIVISNISEIEKAYNTIMDNYSFYQRNIERVYKRKYDFSKAISPLIEMMEND